ncbi:MAG: carbohydrate-binding protein [Cytophagales bacterium]|nr:carbohydrate-binding protein [Cytophaga sp.]
MTKRLLLYSLFSFLFLTNLFAQPSPKRGLAYGFPTQADANAVKPGISWWYNWSDQQSISNSGIEYVAMVWNAGFDVNTTISRIPAGTKYILGFNEPNLSFESKMTPAQAVAAWPRLEQIAAAKNLEIISAVPIYGGDYGGYNDPLAWHKEFFRLCPNCKVDYLAFHTYEGTSGGAIYLKDQLKTLGKNIPIWVTEIADYHAGSAAEEKQYLKDIVANFENDPDVFRYSWFTGRRSDAPVINILAGNGVLTDLGNTYITESHISKRINIAATGTSRIVANKHYRRKGTSLETTTDGGTGQNVSSIDAGDWGEFLVNVASAGSYTMKFRVASLANAGKFDIEVNGVVVKADVSFGTTGGWQTWADVVVTGVPLPVGENLIRIDYKSTQFNFNYIDVSLGTTPIADFTASPLNTCTATNVVFTNASSGIAAGATYSWNFGAGATPATATGIGPYTVTYSTTGAKTISLLVTGATLNTKTAYVTVNGVTTANAGTTPKNISTNTVAMNANTPALGTGLWTLVSGSGTIATAASPTTQITGLTAGTSVYRWTITNGTCKSTSDVTINTLSTAIDIADLEADWYDFYPNPFTGNATFKINSKKDETVSIKIIDMKGAVCYSSETFNSNEDISIGNELSSGIYSVVVVFGDAVKTFKIVKIQ